MPMNYSDLLKYCETDAQRRIIESLASTNNVSQTTKELGLNIRTVQRACKKVKLISQNRGYDPEYDMTKPCSESHLVKGVSTYYDLETGEAKAQWVKTEIDKQKRAEMFIQALSAVLDERIPANLIPCKSKSHQNDLLALYPLGDPHIGLYSWSEETGSDFDCDIAEENLISAMKMLVGLAPAAETAVILNLGDFFHSDNMENRTSRSGNALDVDSRYARVCEIGLKIKIALVELALQKHKQVIVKNLIGNHDDHSSVWLGLALKSHFRKNRRVTIDTSPTKNWYYQFGKNLIGASHGDTLKPKDLSGVMASDVPELWGTSDFRFFFTGHIHSSNSQEFPGMKWESFRTLAAPDAWHSSGKYRSGRDMHCLLFDRNYGAMGRYERGIKIVEESLA